MNKVTEKFFNSCYKCQPVAGPNPPKLLKPRALPECSGLHLVVDLLGPLPTGHSIAILQLILTSKIH